MDFPSTMKNENSEEPLKKKMKWAPYSQTAQSMMNKMGYDDSKGLGKQNQGILEPIVAVQQEGRKGLGLKLTADEAATWDPSLEKINIPEKLEWLESESDEMPYDLMKTWIKLGPRKEIIDDEDRFCDSDILRGVLDCKTVLDNMDDNLMRSACFRSNPFETIRGSIFLNRAAVKMANIDSLTGYMFTEPKDKNGVSLVGEDDLLYFADICAGPGGFSEYILYRKSWKAKGFGFTLKGENDFKLDEFYAGSPESFDPFYGCKDDGNIYDEENQDSLAEYVTRHTEDGVHFVMADGGFSVKGKENIQEILSKQLYLCQCLTALKILRTQGSFVCKLFDLFTPFSVGLIYLMYLSFERIAIIKPNTSRPSNSERYIVCKWKKKDTMEICQYLNDVNRILSENNPDKDVTELVDLNIITQDTKFFMYIKNSNNEFGQNQICALRKLSIFYNNKELNEPQQAKLRIECLKSWNLPDKLRQAPENKSIDQVLSDIVGDKHEKKEYLFRKPKELASMKVLTENVQSIHDWYFVPKVRVETSINDCSMFLCKSRGNLLRCTGKKWEAVQGMFHISSNSLFYGEIVHEHTGQGKKQRSILCLHIIDAIMLGGIDISRFGFEQRNKMCELYTKSMNKPFKDSDRTQIRHKRFYKLADIETFFGDMSLRTLKNNSRRYAYSLDSTDRFYVPGGILLFCVINSKYILIKSQNVKKIYYVNTQTDSRGYMENIEDKVKADLYLPFESTFKKLLIWRWDNVKQVEESPIKDEGSTLLYRCDVREYIQVNEYNKVRTG